MKMVVKLMMIKGKEKSRGLRAEGRGKGSMDQRMKGARFNRQLAICNRQKPYAKTRDQ